MDLKCIWITCNQFVKPNSDMCTMHHLKFRAKDLKVKKLIAFQSAKRKELQKEYVKVVKEMLSENKYCQIKAVGCTGTASGLHHVIKRSEKNLCDKNNLLPCCNSCNLHLETNDKWARANGFVKSKFKN